jgi:hypothetical protein
MLITTLDELKAYIPLHMATIREEDPLVYARLVSTDKTKSLYVLKWEGCSWYGYLISDERCGIDYMLSEEYSHMYWDTTFTPCPLSAITAYLQH